VLTLAHVEQMAKLPPGDLKATELHAQGSFTGQPSPW
jgi:hypothetical protein